MLTPGQKNVLQFIQAEQRKGLTPSTREIQEHFGFASQTSVMQYLAALERKGFLQRHARKARALRISQVIAAIYGFLCLAALLLIPASLGGWFGMARDPLAGIFAILLGAPWSYLLNFIPNLGVWFNVAAVALGSPGESEART